jgi:membrane-associated phospholipid phosphatase
LVFVGAAGQEGIMSDRGHRLVAACVVLAAAVLIASPGSGVAAVAQPAPVEPGAGSWPTWLLSAGSQLRPDGPPGAAATEAELATVRALAAERDQATLDAITYWDAGAPQYRWIQKTVKYLEDHGVVTTRAGRLMALLTVAMYDSTISTWDAKYSFNRSRPSDRDPSLAAISPPASPSYPDERAAAAGAAATVLAYAFPSDADLFSGWANEAAQSRVQAGVAYPSDVADGLTLGQQVGQMAADWGRADGSDAVWTGTVPDQPGKWKGTNPIEPLLGTWKPWVLTSGSQFRPGPRAAPDSDQIKAELAEVRDYPRTNLTNLTASFWEYYGGRASFEFWNDLTTRAVDDYHLDLDPPAAARVYATTDVAYADAVIACWDAKYTYWEARPAMLDPSITTVFVTPNHPSYPSAHSCISGAYAGILARFFPHESEYYQGLAAQAGEARIMGGIHLRSDIRAGEDIARNVASVVWQRAMGT